jgi:hypothetical protein
MRTIYHGGEFWRLHDTGEIERPGCCGPSPSWRVTGAVMRNNFGYVTRRYTLADILADPGAIPWTHRNGAQRVFVRDFDHGSTREWCSRHRIS